MTCQTKQYINFFTASVQIGTVKKSSAFQTVSLFLTDCSLNEIYSYLETYVN